MLKTVKMARISCSVGFLRRDNWYFLIEKVLKLTPKMTKNPKLSFFRNFYAISVKFLTDFVDQNVEKRKQGTVLVQKAFPF